jgi:opacity protein-like surface antigen
MSLAPLSNEHPAEVRVGYGGKRTMQLKRVMLMALLGMLIAAPAPARADWFFTPYIGANFGGDTESAVANDTSVNFGGSLGYMGAGILGFEVDLGYAPNFFEDTPTSDGNVTSFMANVIVGAPIGGMGEGVRPYASGGVGLLRSRIDDADDFFDVTDNSFGINLGGGVMGFLTDNVGVRGDLRYFRSIGDEAAGDDLDLGLRDFDFWRGSFGIAFRF